MGYARTSSSLVFGTIHRGGCNRRDCSLLFFLWVRNPWARVVGIATGKDLRTTVVVAGLA